MPRLFPELVVEPDSHPCQVEHEGRVVSAIADLEADVPPRLHLNGELHDRSGAISRGFPETEELPVLQGRLWSGHDLVAVDCHVETWFPGRTVVLPRYALVGLNAASIEQQAYREMTLQATGLDLLFGRAPLKSVKWPANTNRHLEGEFAATGEPESTQEWTDGGTTITCSYWAQQSSIDNPYRFELRFAPVVKVTSDELRSVDQWVEEFVTPLVRLLTLATRRPQRVSWVTLEGPSGASSGNVTREWPIRVQLFGSGISQSPFISEDASDWRELGTRPIFDLASTGLVLPTLLRAWREIDSGDNPFVELYRLAMLQRDLPKRAQFLYLVQALEALHGYEHRKPDTAAAESYQARRKETIEHVQASGASEEDIRFLKKAWSPRPREDLARRLRSLIRHKDLPSIARETVESLASTVVFAEVSEPSIEHAIRHVRNDLAHGNRNYAEQDLRRWTDVLDALCRAHLRRLLGCPPTVMEGAFRLLDP